MSAWKQLNPAIYKNSTTGRYLFDGRESFWCCPLGCDVCEGRGRIDFRTVTNVMDVVVRNPGKGTTIATARAISDFSENPGEMIVFWDDTEIVNLAKIREVIDI